MIKLMLILLVMITLTFEIEVITSHGRLTNQEILAEIDDDVTKNLMLKKKVQMILNQLTNRE